MTTLLKIDDDKLQEILLIKEEKINKIKTSTNPDYIRSVFNESKDCKVIIWYEKTERPLEGRQFISRTHIKDRIEWFQEGIKRCILVEIAKNPNTPKDILEQLIDMGYYHMCKESCCFEDINEKIISLWNQLGDSESVKIIPPFMKERMNGN